MNSQVVAKVWWQAPHEGLFERFVFADQVVVFGRHSSADIRLGHAPVRDTTVPRLWGELSWHRGRMIISNVDDNWGFDLVPAEDTATASRMTVAAGASASPNTQRFRIEARAPGSEHVLEVMAANPRQFAADYTLNPTPDDVPSFMPFHLTTTQKTIGTTIRSLLGAGGSRRPGYQEIAAAANYSVRTIRENIQVMDATFNLYGLSSVDDRSDALDRVAVALTRHPGILR